MAEPEYGPGKFGWPAHGFSCMNYNKPVCYCREEFTSKMALNVHVENQTKSPLEVEMVVARAIWEEGLRIAKEENAALRAALGEAEELIEQYHAAAYDDPDMNTVAWEHKLGARWDAWRASIKEGK
jgi:hypothetical protein